MDIDIFKSFRSVSRRGENPQKREKVLEMSVFKSLETSSNLQFAFGMTWGHYPLPEGLVIQMECGDKNQNQCFNKEFVTHNYSSVALFVILTIESKQTLHVKLKFI